jgi:hypothetical protein
MRNNTQLRPILRARTTALVLLGATTLSLMGGCAKHDAQATAQDVDAARQEANKEVAQARDEASKDLKSALKEHGDHADVARAKATADFDVAMAKAEGNHKVALEQCLTLKPTQRQPCNDKADADYEAAKTQAKGMRLARLQ